MMVESVTQNLWARIIFEQRFSTIFTFVRYSHIILIKRIIMSKNKQNLVLLMEPSEDAFKIDLKGGNMCMNRFCVDEDAAFELSGVHYLAKSSWLIISNKESKKDIERQSKGKGNLSL